ncbi:MAG TPA: hypothetical protein VIC08_13055 [Cellvibrionaceae bacterium]
MNIISGFSMLHRIAVADPQLPDIKPLLAEWLPHRLRRVDRYIELCVAGGLNCVGGRQLPADTGLYVASRAGAVATAALNMDSITRLGQMPKPLNFVNGLGNSASFHLATALGLGSNTVVLSQEQLSFEAALLHAWLDVQAGVISTALVGGVDEVPLPIADQLRRLHSPDAHALLEGSHWLLLDNSATTGVSIDKIDLLHGDDLAPWLQTADLTAVMCSFAPDTAEQAVFDHAGLEIQRCLPEGVAHGVYSGHSLVQCYQQVPEQGRLCHLSRNDDGGYGAVILRASH